MLENVYDNSIKLKGEIHSFSPESFAGKVASIFVQDTETLSKTP